MMGFAFLPLVLPRKYSPFRNSNSLTLLVIHIPDDEYDEYDDVLVS